MCVDALSRLWLLFTLLNQAKVFICIVNIAKQGTMAMLTWSCLCHAQCHVLSRVNIVTETPALSSGSGGVWVVLRRLSTT